MPADEDKTPKGKPAGSAGRERKKAVPDKKAAAKKAAARKSAAKKSSPEKTAEAEPDVVPVVAQKDLPYFSLLTEDDLFLFNEGSHFGLYEKLGCHLAEVDGVAGAYFAVWAPDAENVSVMGDFNFYNPGEHQLATKGSSGIWEGFSAWR